MLFDPTVRLPKLATAMYWSRLKLQPFRINRLAAIKQFVGANYSDDGALEAVPINLMELTASIYTTQLVAACPQVLIRTDHQDLKELAIRFELGMNYLLKKIKFEAALRRWVMDAIFGLGIMKVGMESSGQTVNINGFEHPSGQPFADTVSLDDWVHDMMAARLDQCSYMGHRYQWPLEEVQQSSLFDPAVTKDLQPLHTRSINETGDTRTANVSRGTTGHANDIDLYDMVELWDIWLPREGKIVTVQGQQDTQNPIDTKPLRIIDWNGPENGPFHLLSYNEVPDQVMPVPPVANWMDIHLMVNQIWRKLGRQAERQKTLTGYDANSPVDAESVNAASDGESIKLHRPESVKEINFGGINQNIFGYGMDLIGRHSYTAGNLDSLGGLSKQADTAEQDKLLDANASKRVSDMQNRTITGTRDVCEALGWHVFYDPFVTLPIVKEVGGVSIHTKFSPEDRQGAFLSYNFKIDPYSMASRSPGEQMQALDAAVEQMVQLGPMLGQQGLQIDFEKWLEIKGRYMQMPELNEIVRQQFPTEPEQPDIGSPPSKDQPLPAMPRNTSRTYNRVSTSGPTRRGADAAKIQSVMGGNPQAAQMVGAQMQGAN